jgi:hypothetical protein
MQQTHTASPMLDQALRVAHEMTADLESSQAIQQVMLATRAEVDHLDEVAFDAQDAIDAGTGPLLPLWHTCVASASGLPA